MIDHASHQKTIDLVKEYNAQFEDKVVAIMLDTKVCFQSYAHLSNDFIEEQRNHNNISLQYTTKNQFMMVFQTRILF